MWNLILVLSEPNLHTLSGFPPTVLYDLERKGLETETHTKLLSKVPGGDAALGEAAQALALQFSQELERQLLG